MEIMDIARSHVRTSPWYSCGAVMRRFVEVRERGGMGVNTNKSKALKLEGGKRVGMRGPWGLC